MRTIVVVMLLSARAVAGPTDAFAPSIVLESDHVAAALTFEANLAPAQFASPASLAPDLWYGVTSDLTLGVIHSDASIDRVPIFFEPGESVCVRLESTSCPRHYHGSGIDGLYSLVRGNFDLALHARLLLRDVDPIKPAITGGATVRWMHRWLSLVADPYIQLGLLHLSAGNRAELWLPITIAFAPLSTASLELHSGYDSDLAVWNDGYHVPLLARLRVHVTDRLDAGIAAGFSSLLGTQNIPRERMMAIDLAWRD